MTENWKPRGIDVSTPSTARMYDYYLGGKDNFPADREVADKALAAYPELRSVALANRGFLVRAVELCAAAGIDQFIDLGTGIPTFPNVHEVARDTHPDARVAYVDHDRIVTAHNKALRATDAGICVVEADVREPEKILADPGLVRLIDFDRPVAVLFVAVMHFIMEAEDPDAVIRAFMDRVPAGSCLALTTATSEGLTQEQVAEAESFYESATSRAVLRTPDRVAEFFDGYELLGPGLVSVARWCEDDELETGGTLAGVGRKP